MKTVLAPIDFSPVTKHVVDEAVALARATDARLVLFHVIAPSFVRTAQRSDRDMKGSYLLRAEKLILAKLRKWQRRLRDQGITVNTVHRIGAAGPQILEQAESMDMDYIVMGSHGHGAFYDLVVGSTTMRVLKSAKCRVVIVPAGNNVAQRRRAAQRRAPSKVTRGAIAAASPGDKKCAALRS